MGHAGARRTVKPTLVVSVLCLGLLLGVWLITQFVHTDRPTTLDGVSQEVFSGIDALQASMPESARPESASTESASTSTSDETVVVACPDGRGGKQVDVTRTITVAPDFDRLAWMTDLSDRYREKGWNVGMRTLSSRDHVEVKLVGPPLLIYRVLTTDESGEALVVIRSSSRCSSTLR
jgi:hypothetical protein